MADTRYSAPIPGHGLDATADPNANTQTRNVLYYLQKISGRSTKNLISGQYVEPTAWTQSGWNAAEAANITALTTLTGKVPGLVSIDYAEFTGFPTDYTLANALVEKYAAAGSLIKVSYHPYNPWTLGNFHDLTVTPGTCADIIDQTKTVYTQWIKQLDGVAVGLAALQAAGVTVIFRPLMEMNGTWFWWSTGATGAMTTAQYAAIWQHMFNYFTNVKGLHNILWEFAANSFTAAATSALPWYPGGAYVDIVGMDDYHDPINFPEYAGFVAWEKPIVYAERGPNVSDGTSQMFVNLQPGTINQFPCVTYFMAYDLGASIVTNQGANALMNSPYVANQDSVAAVMTALAAATTNTARLAAVLN